MRALKILSPFSLAVVIAYVSLTDSASLQSASPTLLVSSEICSSLIRMMSFSELICSAACSDSASNRVSFAKSYFLDNC